MACSNQDLIFQGSKGEKGDTIAAAAQVADGVVPEGFIQGPPGPPGKDGSPGKKVRIDVAYLCQTLNTCSLYCQCKNIK